ncbi:MAG TPA: hypothetical protein VHX62_00945 [Solirubrobacteraceae bacterium]|nr:hypothetical protein [Solirubrobacteraceae bacterium]
MTRTLTRAVAGCATAAVLALGSAAPALAHTGRRHCHGPNGQQQSTNYVAPAALTGSTLASASTAAVNAAGGGTVTKATTVPYSRIQGAAYKVHVAKTDGSPAIVIEDANFNVLAVKTAGNCGHNGTSGTSGTSGPAYAGHLRHHGRHHHGWSHAQ